MKLVTGVVGICNLSGRTDSNTVTPENSLTNLGFGSLSDTIVNKSVSVKRRLRTADCRLRTRGKMQTECKMQTTD